MSTLTNDELKLLRAAVTKMKPNWGESFNHHELGESLGMSEDDAEEAAVSLGRYGFFLLTFGSTHVTPEGARCVRLLEEKEDAEEANQTANAVLLDMYRQTNGSVMKNVDPSHVFEERGCGGKDKTDLLRSLYHQGFIDYDTISDGPCILRLTEKSRALIEQELGEAAPKVRQAASADARGMKFRITKDEMTILAYLHEHATGYDERFLLDPSQVVTTLGITETQLQKDSSYLGGIGLMGLTTAGSPPRVTGVWLSSIGLNFLRDVEAQPGVATTITVAVVSKLWDFAKGPLSAIAFQSLQNVLHGHH